GREHRILEILSVFLRFNIHGRLDLEPKFTIQLSFYRFWHISL
ncbi:MAG: hypothetical protein, partial [Olavius algarvensis Delta 4 endosymbiont]